MSSLSIIIPARNEELLIAAAIDQARDAGDVEVIVADGRSEDRTAAIARQHGARVVASLPGRGRQLNAGATAATGAALLFLHADTRLPECFADHVRGALAQPGVAGGAFALRIDAPGSPFRLLERAVRWRARVLQLPYGDQAIFTTRAAFDAVGGFPDADAMEDFIFVRRLRRRGRIVMVPAPVITSARRWQTGGVWRTTLLNQACIAAYYAGVPPNRIARWRECGAPLPARAGIQSD